MKVPRSVDELMWILAESADPSAVDAFERRYPEYRRELLRRLNMLADLKLARPTLKIDRAPAFHYMPKAAVLPKRLPYLAGAMGLAAIAFAGVAYQVWHAPQTPTTSIKQSQSQTANRQPVPASRPPLTVNRQQSVPEPSAANTVPMGEKPSVVATVRLNGVPLKTAITQIAKAGKIKVEIAPGLENPLIASDYRNLTGLAMLKDMGQTFGFSVLEQGVDSVLIVPAVDPHASPSTSPETPNASALPTVTKSLKGIIAPEKPGKSLSRETAKG